MANLLQIVFPVDPIDCVLFTFFACAKKVTKKAQPISMQKLASAEYFFYRNRR
jgi:hypothetical protein